MQHRISRISGLLILSIVFCLATIPTLANAQEQACVMNDAGNKVCGKLVEDRSNTPYQPIVTLNYPKAKITLIPQEATVLNTLIFATINVFGDEERVARFSNVNISR